MVEPVSRRALQRPSAEPSASLSARSRPWWQYALSIAMTSAIVVVMWRNRAWLMDALALIRTADPGLLAGALAIILLSYLISSQIFQIGLRAMGHRMSWLRLWAATITAIVISQSIPAGGVGSYAYFVNVFKRRGVAPGQSALLAALEALSYAGAMLLVGAFSMIFLGAYTLNGDTSFNIVGPSIAVIVAGCVLGGVVFAATRSDATLTRWLIALGHGVQRVLHKPRSDTRAAALAAELVQGRRVIMAQRWTALLVILIQIVALCGHSLALLLVLHSLGANVSFGVALAAFGVALITSTFNVLPGGGGTVETVLVAVLLQLGVGPAAVAAAIVFRLLNFWALLPAAVVGSMITLWKRDLHEM